MSEWQPIETAPKDGTKCIGYRDGRVSIVYHGEYYSNQFVWFTGRTLPTMNAEPECFDPTHWMPFAPPEGVMTAYKNGWYWGQHYKNDEYVTPWRYDGMRFWSAHYAVKPHHMYWVGKRIIVPRGKKA